MEPPPQPQPQPQLQPRPRLSNEETLESIKKLLTERDNDVIANLELRLCKLYQENDQLKKECLSYYRAENGYRGQIRELQEKLAKMNAAILKFKVDFNDATE